MFITIAPSLDTCGVTVRLSSAWTNTVLVPAADTTEIGIDTPCSIVASLLLSIVIFGAEMMRTLPVFSSADSRRLMLKLPSSEPSVRPSAPPAPVPTAAGMLTAKFGERAPDVRAAGRCALVTASVAPPATPTVDGKTRPVALPVAAESMALPPHWMPMSRRKVELRFDDARLDEHLRRLRVEVAHQVLGQRDVAGDVVDDQLLVRSSTDTCRAATSPR